MGSATRNEGPGGGADSAAYRSWQWRVLLGFCLVYLFYYTGRMNMGIVLAKVREELALSHAQAGILASALFWAYAVGQFVHGRLGDHFGGRKWVSVGAWLSTIFNWVVSFMGSLGGLVTFWSVNGFVQAMGWAPGTRLVAQWWPKKERGKAMGTAVFAAGWATVVVWALAGWASAYGWRWAFRLPVLLLAVAGLAFYILVRDRPSDVGLPDYQEEDEEVAARETLSAEAYTGLRPYLEVFRNWRFVVACVVIGIGNVARYGLLTWIPSYYAEVGGFDVKKAAWVSLALPIGMALGPFMAGWLSDLLFKSRRYPTISAFMILSALTAIGIGLTPISNVAVGTALLFLAGFFVYGAHGPMWALAADLGGRKMAGTATGVMDFVAYLFAAAQAVFFGAFLTLSGGNWPILFFLVGIFSVVGAGLIWLTRR